MVTNTYLPVTLPHNGGGHTSPKKTGKLSSPRGSASSLTATISSSSPSPYP